MGELDFSGKTVLVVGGSSGIGNGVAHAFKRARRAGPRLGHPRRRRGLCRDRGIGSRRASPTPRWTSPAASEIAANQPDFESLDVLVLCQGTVVYKRGEFAPPGWDQVMAVNLDSLMACAMKFRDMLAAAKGSIIIVSSVSGFQANRGNPA